MTLNEYAIFQQIRRDLFYTSSKIELFSSSENEDCKKMASRFEAEIDKIRREIFELKEPEWK